MYELDPHWLKYAKNFLGLREIPGKRHNHTIVDWWKRIGAPFRDDETPWCAAFVGGVLEECGVRSTRSAAARSYTRWGTRLDGPALGSVVVFWRGKPDGWSGHVGFVVGRDKFRNLMVLGGNQDDAVNIKPFARTRVLSYHWPKAYDVPGRTGMDTLPLLMSDGKVSTNES